ncbi:cilia- and flagella-associated protein 61-like [Tubulanus polymorphus]|uniref:cilia- and flagella-associated protein 61-like n=1 Tax=Tubulanus polymorphus TaxID=672921 RepID=UPI003DA55DF9
MTTIYSPSGPTEVINARRTESLDAPDIQKLITPSTELLFGRVNVVNVIEKAVLAVTLSNEKDELLGHAAFYDYPNLRDVDPAAWETWMNNHYNSERSNAINSLFMHFFVAKEEYAHGCAKEIIRTIFNAVPELHYCYVVVPMGVYPESALADIFVPLDKKEGAPPPEGSVVFGCYRHDHAPVLYIRHARVQDHDDLTPIFNRQSDMLKKTYGDYFLAELIEAQDDKMQCLVAEVEGTAIGFMSICKDVNYSLLNECFELGPFHGLRKEHEDDITTPPKTPTPSPPPSVVPAAQHSRTSSASSLKSAGSGTQSVSGTKDQPVEDEATDVEGRKSREGSVESAAQASKASTQADPKVRRKLSESHMAGSRGSWASETGAEDVASAKSAVSPPPSVYSFRSEHGESGVSTLVTPKLQTPQARVQKRFVPEYFGDPNAFSIQLFCIDERYEMRSVDFLSKAFELLPSQDFALVTVPHMVPEFPLLQQFVRVTPRVPSVLSQELYVFNKSGLITTFGVRIACTSDMPAIEKLVGTLELQTNILDDLNQFNKARRDDDGTPIQAYVAECMKQIVGIAIVRREDNIEYIRSHYNIEDFIYFNHHKRQEHGHLHHFAMNPIFNHLSKQFLKEILRLSHKSCLYHPVHAPYASEQVVSKHSLVSALNDMVPVRARRQIDYPLEILGRNAPARRVLQNQTPYALNHINRKLTLEPKVTINARIVVVGASDVGLGFLEAITFCPHLRFNNLTLISPHGLPGELPPDELRDQMLGTSMCYSQDDHANMSLRTWVNVVYGKMTAIDRNTKSVIVNNASVVPYDHLIVCTGQQYQIPCPNEADITKLVTTAEAPYGPDRRYQDIPPKNLFVINDAYDAAVVLYWLENHFLNKSGKVLIYGNNLDAYCCIQTLVTLGISGDRIILVEPPLNDQPTCFNNVTVDNVVMKSLQSLGVQVHQGFILAQWNDGNGGSEIYAASFTSSTKPVRVECAAFFSFYKKTIDYEAFKAINDSCLVFDGKLVIDSSFHTNDVSIRGAGTFTKFQRKYHADQWTHGNFNSKEVGLQLANTMLSLFDPTLEPEKEPPVEILKLIPMYRTPKIQAGVLPGQFHYLHVAKPGLTVALDVQMAQIDFGKEIITGTPGGEPEFFRLHINQYQMVETITCLSKQKISKNLLCLYGIHQRYMNNLLSRFDENLVPDLYSFFSEAWSLALFHDRFPDFRDEVRELLVLQPSENVEALEERVRALVDDDMNINRVTRQALQDEYKNSGAKRAVETRLLSFLTYNDYHLPMYAKPGMV